MQVTPDLRQMSETPKITFIIACYEIPAAYLKQAIDSILKLSLSDHERQIILIDDGSRQTPLSILSDYQREIIYVRQQNQGIAAVRNLGISMAQGQYIQFVDGDDYLIRTNYEHCLDIMRYKNPDLIFFDFTEKLSAVTSLSNIGPMTGAEFMNKYNLKGGACGYIFKKEILGSLRFTIGLNVEDEEFTAKLTLQAQRVFMTDCKAYYYRRRPKSLTHDNDPKVKEKRIEDILYTLTELKAMAQRLEGSQQAALQRRTDQLTMDYLYQCMKIYRNDQAVQRQIQRLTQEGLYPLNNNKYTRKYILFTKLFKHSWIRRIAYLTIPKD